MIFEYKTNNEHYQNITIKGVRESRGTRKDTKQEVVNSKLTNFAPCETFHSLRSELKEVAPESMWD